MSGRASRPGPTSLAEWMPRVMTSTVSSYRASGAERHAKATLVAAVLGFFVITLDATIVNVALPSIRDALGGGITGLQWVVDGYTLMFAALLLSAGALSDRIGARKAFAAGLAVFVVASLACALAPSLPVLVAARVAQGVGAAITMPTSMALVRHAYPDPGPRARAVGVWRYIDKVESRYPVRMYSRIGKPVAITMPTSPNCSSPTSPSPNG
ncbi:MFS transporter, partial [Streptomyces sp. FT05W]